MKLMLLAGLVLGALASSVTPALASCDVAATTVGNACQCDAPWRSHSAYVACVQTTLSSVIRSGGAASRCRTAPFRCAAASVCGRPGAVVCVVGNSCRVVASAVRCTAKGGTVSDADSCCGA